ncbi:MAG: hypothetical protein M5R42_04435 [Rhodocyclaceae bacterium]|nr:hypothetical protein [Rhodocyclaceae bacterium]
MVADDVVSVDTLPRTHRHRQALKTKLREDFRDYTLPGATSAQAGLPDVITARICRAIRPAKHAIRVMDIRTQSGKVQASTRFVT